jgi:hypothetical protein
LGQADVDPVAGLENVLWATRRLKMAATIGAKAETTMSKKNKRPTGGAGQGRNRKAAETPIEQVTEPQVETNEVPELVPYVPEALQSEPATDASVAT